MEPLKSLLLAFALFSRIPVPHTEWREENMRYLMAALPFVGIAVGLCALLWGLVCGWIAAGGLLQGVGFALIPVAVNGGIHMDGFCDTVDALASHGDTAKKQQILRDPHTGSFAVLAACGYLLLMTAFGSEFVLSAQNLFCLIPLFVLSRAVAGVAVVLFPSSSASSMNKSFHDASVKRTSVILLFSVAALSGVLLIFFGGVAGVVALLAPFCLLASCRHMAVRHFGGMSGDLAGWLVQMGELASFGALAVVPRIIAALYVGECL